MDELIWIVSGSVIGILFLIGDCICYAKAKFPERMSSFLYKLPIGGYVSLVKFGRDTD